MTRIYANQLAAHLKQGLAPVYLLSGDEPLQLGEAADEIRSSARDRGYSDREVLDVDARFDWGRLTTAANSLSLFAEQRIIDLRIPGGKPGAEGGKALVEYAGRPPEDTLLLITMPKLERSQTAGKWFKSLERAGVVIQIWPMEGTKLPPWIERRMRSAGLDPAPGVVAMLAERIEGNLLAAAQEIDKLRLLNGPGTITQAQLAASVADSARFDIFGLVDSALAGKAARCVRVLHGLQGEGTPAPVVLWALTREIRVLCSLAWEMEKGRSAAQAMAGRRDIWEKRRPLLSQGLQRVRPARWRRLLSSCGEADRAIKGLSKDDPWLLLEDIATGIAGRTAFG